MRLCAVHDIEPGMVLGKSIYQVSGKLLLGAGFRITSDIRAKLLERQYTHIYIMEEGTEDVVPEDVISDEIRLQAKSKLADKIADIRNQKEFKNITHTQAISLIEEGYLKKVNITYDMRSIIDEIFNDISAAGAQYLNTVMIKSEESYHLDHALNVAVLCILLGRKYKFERRELISLGLGAFLHDIGKIVLEQLKDAENPSKEQQLYREHPTFGYLLLQNSPSVTPIESQVVNQHHEHQDGTGFPIGLKGENLPPLKTVVRKEKRHIYRLAEICCVANVFDNLVYNPKHEEQLAPDQAIKQLILDAGQRYNKDVVQTLVSVVPYYPVGATVKVMDLVDPHLVGYRGVVAKINDSNINRPVIILTRDKFLKKIKPLVIDTSRFTHVDLKLII